MGIDGIQLTSPCEEDKSHGIPTLEIVQEEEEVNPQRTSNDSDYELSDTPYSSQHIGTMSQPLEIEYESPED